MTAKPRRIRLNFWMTICALPVLMVLIGLGTWQLQRLEWKENVIAERAAGLAAPPLAVEEIPPSGWQKFEHRRVTLQGRFEHKFQMPVFNPAQPVDGRTGYDLITPFRLDSGGSVLVDRGWIPIDWAKVDNLVYPDSRMTLTGILRDGRRDNRWVPDNSPKDGDWFYVDVPAMAAYAGLGKFAPYYVKLMPVRNAKTFPLPLDVNSKIRNKHLEYVVTWYGLAATLIVIYVAYHLRRREQEP